MNSNPAASNVLEFRELDNVFLTEEVAALKNDVYELKSLLQEMQEIISVQAPLLGIDQVADILGDLPIRSVDG